MVTLNMYDIETQINLLIVYMQTLRAIPAKFTTPEGTAF